MGRFVAAVVPGDDLEIEAMADVFAERTGEKPVISLDGDAALLSSRPVLEQEGVRVAFNGHLTNDVDSDAEDYILERYREHGRAFPQWLNGSFRVLLYDENRGRLYAACDKAGKNVLYYSGDVDGGIVCSSHLSPLLRHSSVDNELDYGAVSDFVRSWSASFGGGSRLIEGIQRLQPSHLLMYMDGETRKGMFWDVYDRRVDISDREAVKRMNDLMEEAAERMARQNEELNVFLSGGLDSTFLTALLREVSEKKINTYTWGWRDRHFEAARDMAELYGTDHHEIRQEYTLLDREDVWFYEEPQNAFLRYPFRRLYEKGMRGCWTGLNSQATFPVCLDNVRRLDRVRWSRPAMRRLDGRQLRRLMERTAGYKASKGVEILASPYHSTAAVSDWNLRQDEAESMLSPQLRQHMPLPARLDARWGTEDRSYQENYSYLQLRARDTPRYAYYFQDMEHFDVYGYEPLMELSYSLPPHQRKNRRLLRRIAREKVPKRIVTKGASGWLFVTEQFRRMMAREWERYRETVERLLQRGVLDERQMRRILLSRDIYQQSDGRVNQMAALFMLEKWLEVFVDREEPWREP